MNATKHTPGPWQVDAGTIRAGGVRERIALGIVYLDWSEDFAEEASANARLIAAAPELLDVMREAADRIDGLKGGSVSETVAMMRAVIIKATGECSMNAAHTPESLDDQERVINANRSLWWALHNLLEACYAADAAEELGPQVDETLLDAAAVALAATPLYKLPSQVQPFFGKCFAEVDTRWRALIDRMEPGPVREACVRQRATFLGLSTALAAIERALDATKAPDDGPVQ